jgi:hypothetical protein
MGFQIARGCDLKHKLAVVSGSMILPLRQRYGNNPGKNLGKVTLTENSPGKR